MRTLAAWIGLTLAGSSMACSSATYGLGDDEVGDTPADDVAIEDDEDNGETGAEVGDDPGEDTGEDDDDPVGDGDGDDDLPPMQTCTDPPDGPEVDIALFGPYFAIDDCSEPTLSARVMDIDAGSYQLRACACEDPECDGDLLQLDIALPDPAWLPQMELGTCYYFHLYAEEIEPGVCRRNRVDISIDKLEAPWYSAGSASEDLDHNGLAIAPIVADACSDACGDWQVRDVTFLSQETEQTLSWGEDAWVGSYKVVNWRSFATPSGCGGPSIDITSWTAK